MVITLLCQLFLLSIVIRADAVSPAFHPAGFTTWFFQDSVVVNNWLYIVGGKFWLSHGESMDKTIAIDLSQSWTNSSIPAVFTNTSSTWVSSRAPSLWYDPLADLVYSFGGYRYNGTNKKDPPIWAFRPYDNGSASWHKNTSSEDSLWGRISSTFGALTAISSDAFYSLGGIISPSVFVVPGSLMETESGMAKFGFEDNNWTNLSSAGYGVAGTGMLGQAEYIATFGRKGIIVFLGGDAPTASYSFLTGSSLVDMGVVTIYDIDSAKWLTQATTGNIPARRYGFCMAGASETNSKSYELFLFGGLSSTIHNQAISVSFTVVYLLSIPLFSWVRIDGSATQMRAFHKCEVIGNRQMLLIGGYDPSSSAIGNIPDTFRNGLGIFDMSNLSWSNQYDHQALKYVRPRSINEYYTKNTQSPTWDSPEVQSLFETSAANTQPTSSLTASPTGSITLLSRHHKAIGRIVGAAVGGVIGAIVLVLLVFWLMKHRRWWIDITDGQVPNLNHELQASSTPELEQTIWELDDMSQPQYLSRPEMEATHRIPNRNSQASELMSLRLSKNMQLEGSGLSS